MTGWDKVSAPVKPEPDDINQRDWQSPKRTQHQCWNDRIDSTNAMLRIGFDGTLYFAYYVTGAPVGIVALEKHKCVAYVVGLVTRPCSEGAGGILLE